MRKSPKHINRPHYKALYKEKCAVNRNLNKSIDLLNNEISALKAAPDAETKKEPQTEVISCYSILAELNARCASTIAINLKNKEWI